jgi:acetyl-CoA carboxylase biotin carboxyl carrier protein
MMAKIDIKTELTGNVIKVAKAVGDTVTENEAIIILESMKMELPIAAPEEGKVIEILVKEGQVAKEGSVVARMEV